MAGVEFNGYRKLRVFENGTYSDSVSRMKRAEAELYCIANGYRFDGFVWRWQVYVGVKI